MGTGRLVVGVLACGLMACSGASEGALGVASNAEDAGQADAAVDAEDLDRDADTSADGGAVVVREDASADSSAEASAIDDASDARVDSGADASGATDASADTGADARSDAAADASADATPDVVTPVATCSDAGRYSVAGDEVTDSTTGRVWSRSVSMQLKKGPANTACSSRGSGWRLPTKVELEALVRIESGCVPTIDQLAFPNTPATFTNQHDDSFWTDSAGTLPGGSYYLVRFHNGSTIQGLVSSTANVRCVR